MPLPYGFGLKYGLQCRQLGPCGASLPCFAAYADLSVHSRRRHVVCSSQTESKCLDAPDTKSPSVGRCALLRDGCLEEVVPARSGACCSEDEELSLRMSAPANMWKASGPRRRGENMKHVVLQPTHGIWNGDVGWKAPLPITLLSLHTRRSVQY
uniref:Uncharacterized protein n=1 Tax=Coccidioides posadasii RMSCC 3488 TaxID=454284 RepID=A0A0J6FQJ8_COCPO|nr:hypothetical protein CPAG_07591 [Coccidioides posadasii RMSCC 3488]